MEGTIVGFTPVDYKKQDGTLVEGVNIYITYENIEVIGLKTKEIFISARFPVFRKLKPYLEDDCEKLLDMPVDFAYDSEEKGGRTFSRLVTFKLLEDRLTSPALPDKK